MRMHDYEVRLHSGSEIVTAEAIRVGMAGELVFTTMGEAVRIFARKCWLEVRISTKKDGGDGGES